MDVITFRRSSLLCFLVMPLLIVTVIGTHQLGYISGSTEVPSVISSIINWRTSSKVFSYNLLGGIVVCALITGYAAFRRDEFIRDGWLERLFDFVGKLVVNNFYFWSGNFLAYTLASRMLDFVEPIDSQGIMVLLTALLALVFEFFLSILKVLFFRPRFQ
ncbi:hypothetical protein [Pseudomonas vanderleydeniana]|uniref:Uncharacterized protein n=1 Tax=Pseudomonas vanderleydeniana TaxID=2745495 RepID=A0A9E6PH13_9PSED|nr:hypothetical protein [Pseudomonas vanderleydeniana]QXI26421.1 hypothetical protein HU752_021075 [Pseudomonas vanderleydeniana]